MSNLRAKKVKALLEKFRIIASERLERLNNSFLQLEAQPDDKEAAATLVREIHTLKGEAKLMGFETVNLVAHKTEDLIFRARDQEFRVSEELSHTVLGGLDVVANLDVSQLCGPHVATINRFVPETIRTNDRPGVDHHTIPDRRVFVKHCIRKDRYVAAKFRTRQNADSRMDRTTVADLHLVADRRPRVYGNIGTDLGGIAHVRGRTHARGARAAYGTKMGYDPGKARVHIVNAYERNPVHK